jgi:hypothetical protein
LAERLNDSDDNTRHEAMVGLAKRKDRRAIPAISTELASDCVENMAIEAATMMAAPQLYPLLIVFKERCGGNKELLSEAIAACTPSAGETDSCTSDNKETR